jgi:hypothetical protein
MLTPNNSILFIARSFDCTEMLAARNIFMPRMTEPISERASLATAGVKLQVVRSILICISIVGTSFGI